MSELKIKAVYDNIAIKDVEKEMSTESGIVLSDNAVSMPQAHGIVISKGDSVKSEVEEGDEVMFHPNAGMTVLPDPTKPENKFRIVKDGEIYGITSREVK